MLSRWRLLPTAAPRRSEQSIARLDSTVISIKNGQRVHQWVRIASQAANDALPFGAQFGPSPISLLRLSGMEPPGSPLKFCNLLA